MVLTIKAFKESHFLQKSSMAAISFFIFHVLGHTWACRNSFIFHLMKLFQVPFYSSHDSQTVEMVSIHYKIAF